MAYGSALRIGALAIGLSCAACGGESAPTIDEDEGASTRDSALPAPETDASSTSASPDERDSGAPSTLIDASREPGGREGGSGRDRRDARTQEPARDGGSTTLSDASVGSSCGSVGPVPDEVRQRLKLDAFYKKHIDANGLPVISSAAPDDRSLVLACELLNMLLQKRDDVRKELIRRGARFAIIGQREGTAEIPEYGYRERSQAERDMINQRARGLGGQVASCGEENILCLRGDRYPDESICLHEFSHTITTYGAYGADKTFQQRLQTAYESARDRGILDDTYRKENAQEYWAEGAQDWFDTNATANPSNGIHNQVNTRSELMTFDPGLYMLAAELFPSDARWNDCHVRR